LNAPRKRVNSHGDKIVLLVAGYDNLADPSKKRENAEIALARRRLADFKSERSRQRKARKTGR